LYIEPEAAVPGLHMLIRTLSLAADDEFTVLLPHRDLDTMPPE
jgi:hypothetical protein